LYGKFDITGVVESKEEGRRVEGHKERSWEDVRSLCYFNLLQKVRGIIFCFLQCLWWTGEKSNGPKLHQDLFRLDSPKIL